MTTFSVHPIAIKTYHKDMETPLPRELTLFHKADFENGR